MPCKWFCASESLSVNDGFWHHPHTGWITWQGRCLAQGHWHNHQTQLNHHLQMLCFLYSQMSRLLWCSEMKVFFNLYQWTKMSDSCIVAPGFRNYFRQTVTWRHSNNLFFFFLPRIMDQILASCLSRSSLQKDTRSIMYGQWGTASLDEQVKAITWQYAIILYFFMVVLSYS